MDRQEWDECPLIADESALERRTPAVRPPTPSDLEHALADAEEDALVEGGARPAARLWRCGAAPARAAAPLLLALAAAAALLAAAGRGALAGGARLRGVAELEERFCGGMEEDVEFHTEASLEAFDGILSADACCARCDADPRCGVWTFAARPAAGGVAGRCLLKRLEHGVEPRRIARVGTISGRPAGHLRKHGVTAELLEEAGRRPDKGAEVGGILANQTCPGSINVTGHGMLSVVSATWSTPGERAGRVVVAEGAWAVAPGLQGRAYLAENCTPGSYNHDDYVAMKLLGKTLRYQTDVSRTGCGCVAQLQLVPMQQNNWQSHCGDYYCGAAGQAAACGVPCSEIDIQNANQYAWSSVLHARGDAEGVGSGYGGSHLWSHFPSWSNSDYGPGARCIDTAWPFEVAVSFPVDEKGTLTAMEVVLSQGGHDCTLRALLDTYSLNGQSALAELSTVLETGATPVISYWSSRDLRWLDGMGGDGRGPCVQDSPEACPASVRFYGFVVEDIATEKRSPPSEDSVLDIAAATIHESVSSEAASRRKAELEALLAPPPRPSEVVEGSEEDCHPNCDASNVEVMSNALAEAASKQAKTYNQSAMGLNGTFNRSTLGFNDSSNQSAVGLNSTLNRSAFGLNGTSNRSALGLNGTFNRSISGLNATFNQSVLDLNETKISQHSVMSALDIFGKADAVGQQPSFPEERSDGNVEWEVVTDEAPVVAQRASSATVLDVKLRSAVAFGKEEDGWLVLARKTGYMAILHNGTVLLRKRVVSYTAIPGGSCASNGAFPILDIDVCRAATLALGYFDASLQVHNGDGERPEGCHLQRGNVWLDATEANQGRGAVGSFQPICSSESYTRTTTTTSTTSTITETTTVTSTTTSTTTTTTWAFPSLFCLSVMRTTGYELGLVKAQIHHGVGIFQCDEYGVFSTDSSVDLGRLPHGQMVTTIQFKKAKVGVSQDHTAANTQLFMNLWAEVERDGRYQRHQWTIKADPDAVVLSWRLRERLREHTGPKNYLVNCNKHPGAKNFPMIFGAVEAYSARAMLAYFEDANRCRTELHWHEWGEDFFMGRCMKLLGVAEFDDFAVVGDKRCMGADCGDGVAGAYHDFKSIDSWFKCWKQATR